MINKVVLVGRIGKEPETKYMSNNDPVCYFLLATSESWRDKTTGQKQESVEWHNVVAYRRTAEVIHQYCHKGDLLFVDGKIKSQKYIGKDGIERTAYNIIANSITMLGSKSGKEQEQEQEPYNPDNDGLDENDIPF